MVSVVGVITAVTSAITGAVVSSVDSSFSPQEKMMVRLKRNMERMMSICFTRLPISGLGYTKKYHYLVNFTRNRHFLGGFFRRV